MTLRTSDNYLITAESIERAFDHHQRTGKILRWHSWHETHPSRKRPLYTVTMRGSVLDIATLWEAYALCAGLAQLSNAQRDTFRERVNCDAHAGAHREIDVCENPRSL